MITPVGHRELRAVAAGWQHPAGGTYPGGSTRYVPLFSRRDWERHSEPRDPADYMPVIPEGAPFQWVLYETTTEGTPASPPFDDIAELAAWCADGASAYAGEQWTGEQWAAAIEAATVTGSTMVL